jgi:GNAT superfamily N-acetyltransferase
VTLVIEPVGPERWPDVEALFERPDPRGGTPIEGLDPEPNDIVFSVTCFFIDRDARGEGISNALLDAAIDGARRRGATVLEAYPKAEVPPHARRGGSAEQNESFMGRRHQFEARGFTLVNDAGARLVLRRTL